MTTRLEGGAFVGRGVVSPHTRPVIASIQVAMRAANQREQPRLAE